MGYVYVKKRASKKRPALTIPKIEKINKKHISLALLSLGIFAFASVLYPIVGFQFFYSGRFKQVISPLSSGFYNKDSNIGGVTADYTQLSSWFVQDDNKDVTPSKELLSENGLQKYQISIPKVGINNADVEIGTMDLKKSIIHYPQTAMPGQKGNAVIFGHSVLPQFFNPKSYLTIFSTLFKLKANDKILIRYDNVNYTYNIEDIFEVKATDFSILDQRYDGKFLTLVTCSPPGTYIRRLVVKARIVE
jgi:sortase A